MIINCIFVTNQAYIGAGIFNENSSNPTVTNCIFSDNQSETFYKGDKSYEIADYSYNYQVGTQTVKSTSVFFYNPVTGQTGPQRAGSADTDSYMTTSLSFKDSRTVSDSDIYYGTGAIKTKLTSETIYAGTVKGDEIADYAYNYQTNKNTGGAYTDSTLKTVSVYLYGDNKDRANAPDSSRIFASSRSCSASRPSQMHP